MVDGLPGLERVAWALRETTLQWVAGAMGSPDEVPSRSSLRGLGVWGVVVALLAVHAALAISSLSRKSATFDEMVRLTAGYSYWVTGDYRLDPAEPPLAQMWAALPLLGGQYRFPDLNQPAWWIGDAESIGRQFFFALGNDLDAMLFRARVMIVLLSVGLGLIIYLWSQRLFGPGAGMLSLVLYAFSPNLLAHARLVTTETATCLFFVASVAGLWWVAHEVRPASVLASGAALAGLFGSKMSAPLIVPVGVLILLVALVSRRPLRVRLGRAVEIDRRAARLAVCLVVIVIQAAIAIGAMWAVHRFRYAGMVDPVPGRDRYCPPAPLPSDASSWDYVLTDAGTVGQVVDWCRRHRLLPESYLYGVAFQSGMLHSGYGFLNGERRISGWWYFFPYGLAVKTPLALFGLLALAGVAALWGRSKGRDPTSPKPATLAGVLAIAFFLAVYWAVAVRANLNIGHRHILPTYPFMIILAGAAARWWQSPVRSMRWLTAACTGLFVLASIRLWPNYLACFNVLAGGPANGYRHLVDSSLDWGQDLPGLKRWLDAAPDGPYPGETLYLSYFGTDSPERFGIEATMLPSHMPWRQPTLESLKGGVYCISATMLQLMYIMPTNEWTETFETTYQLLKPDYGATRPTSSAPSEEVGSFRLLRFARLCAALRDRPPDDCVNHAILIYRLTDEDLTGILDGPSPTLYLDDPVKNGPKQLAYMLQLGRMLARRGHDDDAIERYKRVMRYDPSQIRAVNGSVAILVRQRQFDRAAAVFRRALGHSPDSVPLLNGLAWLLATSPRDDLRDGAEALRLAARACSLSARENWQILDTVAAAHAETGRFQQAVQFARKAESLARRAGLTPQADRVAERVALYLAGKPYRQ